MKEKAQWLVVANSITDNNTAAPLISSPLQILVQGKEREEEEEEEEACRAKEGESMSLYACREAKKPLDLKEIARLTS
jgi:hypothetical protein